MMRGYENLLFDVKIRKKEIIEILKTFNLQHSI